MSKPHQAAQLLVSELSTDPNMIELVEMFVQELPPKADALEQNLTDRNFDNLAKIAHQLKGSAGGYGFPYITEKAALVEHSAKGGHELEHLPQDVRQLALLCRSARATPDSP